MMLAGSQKEKLTANFPVFPPEKFYKIWQTGYNFFNLLDLGFQENHQTTDGETAR